MGVAERAAAGAEPTIVERSSSTAQSYPLDAGTIFIQTAVPGPEGSDSGIFDLYRDHRLLDSGWWFERPELRFSFQALVGAF